MNFVGNENEMMRMNGMHFRNNSKNYKFIES